MTQRARADRFYKALSKASKWVKYHLNRKLGMMMTDLVQDMWDKSYR